MNTPEAELTEGPDSAVGRADQSSMTQTMSTSVRPKWLSLLVRQWRWIVVGLTVWLFFFVVSRPLPQGLTPEGLKALAIFLVCIIFWVTGVVPLMITSLLAVILFPLAGVLKASEAYELFGNQAVMFILGAFILASALMRSGLSQRIALLVLRRFGKTPRQLVSSILLLSAFMSFWIISHGVVAMMFPIVTDISLALKLKPGRSRYGTALFLAMAWGTIIGGITTLLGSARAPLAIGILREMTGQTIGFVPWVLASVPTVVLLLGVTLLALHLFFSTDVTDIASAEVLLAEKTRGLGPLSGKEKGIGVLMVATIVCWVALGDRLGLANIALAAVVIAFIFQLMTWKEVEEDVNWGVYLLYGGAIVMGLALERTGAASWVAQHTLGMFVHAPIPLLMVIVFIGIFLTEVISNAAVVASFMPVTIGLARDVALDPRIVTLALTIPTGLAFMLPISTPAMALAFSSGFVRARDTLLVGFFLNIIAWGIFCLLAVFYWPLIGFKI